MIYRFEDCRLDTERFELVRGGRPVEVQPQVLELLTVLVEGRERMLGKDEILARVWRGRIVSDSALSSAIKAARQAIGDDGRAQRLIETRHGRGFRFRGAVEVEGDATFGWTPDPAAAIGRAGAAAARALALGPADAWALLAFGCCRLMARDHAGALHELRRAVEAEPSSALAHGTLALAHAFAGEAEAAFEAAARADRLSPFDPRAGIWINAEGVAAVLSRRFERGLAAGRRLAALKPDYPAGHRIMAAAAAGLGDAATARAAVDRLLELLPGHRAAQAGAALPFGTPALADAYAALLVRAGLAP